MPKANTKAAKPNAAKGKSKAQPDSGIDRAAQAALRAAGGAASEARSLPAHVTTEQGERRLEADDIRGRTMCDASAMTRFTRGAQGSYTMVNETTWVEAQMRLVPDRWVKGRAHLLATCHHGDIRWAAHNLLPEGWGAIYDQATRDALREARLDQRPDGSVKGYGRVPNRGFYRRRMKVRLATFAALYVEAGRA